MDEIERWLQEARIRKSIRMRYRPVMQPPDGFIDKRPEEQRMKVEQYDFTRMEIHPDDQPLIQDVVGQILSRRRAIEKAKLYGTEDFDSVGGLNEDF